MKRLDILLLYLHAMWPCDQMNENSEHMNMLVIYWNINQKSQRCILHQIGLA